MPLVAHGLAVHRLKGLLRRTGRVKLHDTTSFGLTGGHIDADAGVDHGPSTSSIEKIFQLAPVDIKRNVANEQSSSLEVLLETLISGGHARRKPSARRRSDRIKGYPL